MKKSTKWGMILSTAIVGIAATAAVAQNAAKPEEGSTPPTPPVITPTIQRAFSAVGVIDYVEFKKGADSTVAVKDKDGNVTVVSLENVCKDSMVLATYRKEKDEKGAEKNVLVTLSIIRNAEKKAETKADAGKKDEPKKDKKR